MIINPIFLFLIYTSLFFIISTAYLCIKNEELKLTMLDLSEEIVYLIEDNNLYKEMLKKIK